MLRTSEKILAMLCPQKRGLIQDRPFPEHSSSYPSEALCVAPQTRWLQVFMYGDIYCRQGGSRLFWPLGFFPATNRLQVFMFLLLLRRKTPGSKAWMFQTTFKLLSKFSDKFFALLRGMLQKMKKNIRRVIKKKNASGKYFLRKLTALIIVNYTGTLLPLAWVRKYSP